MPLAPFKDLAADERFKALDPEKQQVAADRYWDQYAAENPDLGDYATAQRQTTKGYLGLKAAAKDAAPVQQRELDLAAKDAAFNFSLSEKVARGEIPQEKLKEYAGEYADRTRDERARLAKTRSLGDPETAKGMQAAFEALGTHARRGGVFGSPSWDARSSDILPGGEKDAVKTAREAYSKLRDDVATDFHLSAEELDDVVKHQMDLQPEPVSRDVLGTPYIKNEVLAQGTDATAAAITASGLPESAKKRMLDGLPERMASFKQSVVEDVKDKHPELAQDIGLGRQKLDPTNKVSEGDVPAGYRYPTVDEDFATITDALNKGRTSQGFGGALAGALGTAEFLPGKNGADAEANRKIQESVNQVSADLNRQKTQVLGTDAAAFGQGVYSVAEAIGVGALTGGEGAIPALTRLEKLGTWGKRLASSANAAIKVAPVAGLAAVKSGNQTYEQAIAAGKTPEDAAKFAFESAAIEFGVTTLFSAAHLGGVEDIGGALASQASKEAVKKGLGSFLKETGKGIVGEELEENLITALDSTAVQAKINPGMSQEDLMRQIKDTALVTLAVSGPASAIHAWSEVRKKPTYEQSTQQLEINANLALADATKPGPADPLAAGAAAPEPAAPVRAVDPAADGAPAVDPGVSDSGVRDAGTGSESPGVNPSETVPELPPEAPVPAEPTPTPQTDGQDEKGQGQGRQEVLTSEETDQQFTARRKAEATTARRAANAEAGPAGKRLNEIETKWEKEGVEVVPTLLKDGSTELTVLRVPEGDRGKGKGSEVLSDLKKAADESGKPLVLQASDIDQTGKDPGKFYEQNGFEPVGKNKYRYDPTPQTDEQNEGQKGQGRQDAQPEVAEPETPKAEKPPETKEPATTGEPDEKTLGTRHAKTEELRKELGLPERIPAPAEKVEQWDDDAKAARAANPNVAWDTVAKIEESKRPLTDRENLILLREQPLQKERVKKANEALAKATDENRVGLLEDADRELTKLVKLQNALEVAGTEWGKAGVSRQQDLREDFSLERMLAKEQQASGKPVTPEARQQITELAAKLEQLGKDLEGIKETQGHLAALNTFKEQTRKFKKEAKSAMAQGEKPQSFLERQAQAAKDRILARKREGRQQLNLDPTDLADHAIVGVSYIANGIKTIADFTSKLVKDFGEYVREHAPEIFKKSQELSKQTAQKPSKVKTREEALSGIKPGDPVNGKVVYDLARGHINAGVDGFENVMNAVLADLKPTHPDLTLRQVHDAYSGYGQVKFPSKEADKQKLSDYKNLARLQSQLEDVMRGEAPKRTGPQRNEPSARARELQRKVREEMRRLGIKPQGQKTALRTGLDSTKARLRNAIEDLDRAIKEGKPITTGKTPVELDEEAKALKERRDALKADYDRIFGKNDLTDFQRSQQAVKTLNKLISDEEDLLAKGLASRPKTGPKASAWTPEIADLHSRLDALRENRAKLRKALRPNADPEQTAVQRATKALERSVKNLREIVATGNPNKEGPAKPPLTPTAEMKNLLKEQAALKEAAAELRANAPATHSQEATLLKRLNEQLADLDRRIRTNDLSVKPRKGSSAFDPLTSKIRQQIAQRQATLAALKKAARPKLSPEAARFKREKAAIRGRIKRLNERIANDDYAPRVKPDRLMDAEKERLQVEEMEVKKKFNERLWQHHLAQQSKAKRIFDTTLDILGVPRSLMTSADFGAVLRQGGFLTLGNPTRLFRSLPANFQAIRRVGYQRIQNKIEKNPYHTAAQKAGLYLAPWQPGHDLSAMEEVYRSRLVKKIPLAGKVVEASERTYVAYLNSLRMDTFASLARSLDRGGNLNDDSLKAIARFVNIASGRGALGKFETAASALANVFFSPKYVASRFQLVGGLLKSAADAGTLFKTGSKETRAARKLIAWEYAKFLGGVGVIYSTVAAAAKALWDDKDPERPSISFDPRSADFGKIKMGKTRLDLMAGLAQTTTFLGRAITGETVGPKGDVRKLRGDSVQFGKGNLAGVVGQFLRSKLAPLPSTALNLFSGEDVAGQKVHPETELLGSLLPLSVGDVFSAMQEQGIPRGAALSLLGIFGAGVQTYGNNVQPMEEQAFQALGVPASRYKAKDKGGKGKPGLPVLPKLPALPKH